LHARSSRRLYRLSIREIFRLFPNRRSVESYTDSARVYNERLMRRHSRDSHRDSRRSTSCIIFRHERAIARRSLRALSHDGVFAELLLDFCSVTDNVKEAMIILPTVSISLDLLLKPLRCIGVGRIRFHESLQRLNLIRNCMLSNESTSNRTCFQRGSQFRVDCFGVKSLIKRFV